VEQSGKENNQDHSRTPHVPFALFEQINLGRHNLLAPICRQLHQYTDEPSKEVALCKSSSKTWQRISPLFGTSRTAYCSKASSTTLQFGSQLQNLSSWHLFACGKHEKLWAADQEKESQEDSIFDQLTRKMPEAVKKHHSKLPLPLPMMVAELMPFICWRMIALTVGLSTEHCVLTIQLKELHTELKGREQHVMVYLFYLQA
jgi:hypothetical protein